MIARIRTRLFDILAGDIRLIRPGNAYTPAAPGFGGPPPAFTGVKRLDSGDAPLNGYVNLIESWFEPNSNDMRPAIYAGMRGNEGTDDLEFESVSSVWQENRLFNLPLVVVTAAATRKLARQQRDQLIANVKYILMDYRVDPAGTWWLLRIPGKKAGGDMRQQLFGSGTGSGQGQAQFVEGDVIPLEIHYSMVAGGTDA